MNIVVCAQKYANDAKTAARNNYFIAAFISLLAHLMGQYCLLAGVCCLSVVVCNAAGGRAGRQARQRSGGRHCTVGEQCSKIRIFFRFQKNDFLRFLKWGRAHQKVVSKSLVLTPSSSHTSLSDHCKHIKLAESRPMSI